MIHTFLPAYDEQDNPTLINAAHITRINIINRKAYIKADTGYIEYTLTNNWQTAVQQLHIGENN
jgi:hypothetical protein